ncbi:MAG: hypothetical protein FJ125_13085 [Deltaproteobacteria bacterium]|nr:hypothetical protein [Deltaproteobacteria bacterium]
MLRPRTMRATPCGPPGPRPPSDPGGAGSHGDQRGQRGATGGQGGAAGSVLRKVAGLGAAGRAGRGGAGWPGARRDGGRALLRTVAERDDLAAGDRQDRSRERYDELDQAAEGHRLWTNVGLGTAAVGLASGLALCWSRRCWSNGGTYGGAGEGPTSGVTMTGWPSGRGAAFLLRW